ncbi:hypothetical protein [Streptomyces sp. NPDC058268]|uniref:hypothetical protein n=1 Tax=Streptomyces sp. NPDC058268 TaxID=3346413 RepID=UPI0036E97117
MPRHPLRPVRKPSAAAVSRILADRSALGLYRATRPGKAGFTVRTVTTAQRPEHGGPVTITWTEPPSEDSAALRAGRERAMQLLIQVVLESADYQAAIDPRGRLVLLAPEDAEAHEEATRRANELLGSAAEFRRSDAGLLTSEDDERTPRERAVAEVALALRYPGRAVTKEDTGTRIFFEQEARTVTFAPEQPDETPNPSTPLRAAARVFRQAGENVLDDESMPGGTGVLLRTSRMPDEVVMLRLDEGRRTVGFGEKGWLFKQRMTWYRMLLETDGWTMVGDSELGWSFYRPTAENAIERATKALTTLFAPYEMDVRSGWRISESENATAFRVQWVSELTDEERRETAQSVMLSYLGDTLRRVGLATTLLEEPSGWATALYAADPPAGTGKARHLAVERNGIWWVDDTHTGIPRRSAGNGEHAERLARDFNREADHHRRDGMSSDGLPGVPGPRMDHALVVVAADLAAAGLRPWDPSDRSGTGYSVYVDGPAVVVHRVTSGAGVARPEDTAAADAFDDDLFAYAFALDAAGSGRVVVREIEEVKVWGVLI